MLVFASFYISVIDLFDFIKFFLLRFWSCSLIVRSAV